MNKKKLIFVESLPWFGFRTLKVYYFERHHISGSFLSEVKEPVFLFVSND